MTRALVRLLPFEMAMLCLFEFTFLFALTFILLTVGSPSVMMNSAALPRDCLFLAAMLAMTIAGTAATIGLYSPAVCIDRRRFLIRGTTTALLAFPAILLVVGAYRTNLTGEHVALLAGLLAIWLSFVLLVRFGLNALASWVRVTRRVLIVGDGARAARLRRLLAARHRGQFETLGPVTLDGQDDGPAQRDAGRAAGLSARVVHDWRVWAIVIAEDEPAPFTHAALLDNKLRGVPIYTDHAFQENHLGRIEPDSLNANWLLFADGFRNGIVSRAIKRMTDIAAALLLTIVTLPLMLVTAAAIAMDRSGPVFYRQERIGLHGKPFTLLKFRSMATDAEAEGKPQWAQKRDPRITRVGAMIRASRIDELPQLFNVLRGEMSMIGPRPERPVFVEELARVIPFYNDRCYVKPGLTGWAQVNYPYGASVEDAREKLAYDLYYVKNHGLLLDLVILLSTVRVILFHEGAR